MPAMTRAEQQRGEHEQPPRLHVRAEEEEQTRPEQQAERPLAQAHASGPPAPGSRVRAGRHGHLVEHAADDPSPDLGPRPRLAGTMRCASTDGGERLHVVGQHVVAPERDGAGLRASGERTRSTGARRPSATSGASRVAATIATT